MKYYHSSVTSTFVHIHTITEGGVEYYPKYSLTLICVYHVLNMFFVSEDTILK